MKTISIAAMAAAMVFIAANSYACGNQTKADVKSSSASVTTSQGQACSASCMSRGSASQTAGKGVKVMTTEYRKPANAKTVSPDANSGSCSMEKGTGASASAANSGMAAKTKPATRKNSNPMVLMGAADLTTIIDW